MPNTPIRILLADDDAVDRDLFAEAMRETGFPHLIHEVENGEVLLQYLDGAAEKPDVIVLDFNMPIKDGRVTLRELKAHDAHKRIPVFILSTSNAHFDMTMAYENGAALFLVKPNSYTGLVEMLKDLFNVFMKHTPYAVNQRATS